MYLRAIATGSHLFSAPALDSGKPRRRTWLLFVALVGVGLLAPFAAATAANSLS
jgi:hypothetical protein